MKIPSHLWQSRHGVFYFRITGKSSGKQISKRLSLQTKDPTNARQQAIMLLAQMSQLSNMKPIKKFEVALAGMTFKTDPAIPNDYEI